MDIESFREYCLQKKGTTESFPFDRNTLVFKVGNKMYALTNIDEFNFVNLKCDPERALDLRETFNGIQPGYHMNKRLWNSVYQNKDVSDNLLFELIDHSYDLIVASLPKKVRNELQA